MLPLPSGGFRMYYHGHVGFGDYLLSAISNDGLTWTREPGVRIDPSALCPPATVLGNVSMVYDGGFLHLFIAGSLCTGQYTNEKNGIWEATSGDGLSFVFPASPIVQSYYRKSQFTGNLATDPVVQAQDPAAILTPGGIRVFFGLYGGGQLIPESGIYSTSGPG